MNAFESRLSAVLGNMNSKVLLAAVSGGADSTAMLAALAALRKEAGFALHCVHVEHGIRPAEESRGDAAEVEALCAQLDVPCRVVSIPPGRIAAFASNGGPGIEAAARLFRHRALGRERRRVKAGWILTAHTRDDQLENLLMRLLKGSGPAGLAPMPQNRGCLLRPLLDLGRKDVLEYLEDRGIPYRTDSTNADIKFLRNRIRHKLIPLLDEFFPSWQVSLMAMAETQAMAAEFLASEATKRLPWEKRDSGCRLREEDFLKAPPILREEAVFAGVDLLVNMAPKGRGRKPGRVPRRSTVRQAVLGGAVGDLGPARLERRYGFITLCPVTRGPGERGFSLLIKEAGSYTLKAKTVGLKKDLRISADISQNQETPFSGAVFSAGLPLVLRNHYKGDCIIKGGHKRRFSDILNGGVGSGNRRVITACDAEGPAVFITAGDDSAHELLVIRRDDTEAGSKYLFEVFGGLNV